MISTIKIKRPLMGPLTKANGFTFVELMVVIALLGVLSSIAIMNYMPMRTKTLDAAALSDARNLVDSVINATMSRQDVDYDTFGAPIVGDAVGGVDTLGNPRKPVFVLSPGVAAIISGSSAEAPNGNTTVFSATVYHTGGTPDGSPSGRKEYVCSVDEGSGVIIVPQ